MAHVGLDNERCPTPFSTKSGAEKHAAQLEKWVSSYLEREGAAAKGILVVNAFKDEPPDMRAGDAFPAQMVEYSERRDHCLITGLQLLGAWRDGQRSAARRKAIVKKIFTTSGVFPDYEDVSAVLELPPAVEKDKATSADGK